MPDVPRKQQVKVWWEGRLQFSSKDGRNSYGKAFEEKKIAKKKENLHMQLELHIFACVASCWFS